MSKKWSQKAWLKRKDINKHKNGMEDSNNNNSNNNNNNNKAKWIITTIIKNVPSGLSSGSNFGGEEGPEIVLFLSSSVIGILSRTFNSGMFLMIQAL